ncbi:hypothetical protein [uncultured Bacteroides sp.]|uniref:hypothetical protein n=1 Tax=uncultured Bacteroides sp. TaxID=162156 RepID=UPI002AABB5DB|nr:hypothetical protein [uncultured Bacteroides sp.]
MNEPKIYSISTVGVLKHFNQDYLLHPLRTDFTGGNGVGKSIIADLIQIIFICYEKHIKFGTDGFTKEKREIRKLPYKNNEGYAFLNIKIKEEQFITLGVNIQSRSGKRIRPFLILSKPDMNLPLTDLVYGSSKILTYRDFLNEQHKILPLDELSKRLKEKYQLFLTYFPFNEDIERYHSFLFEKEILPINLTIPEQLKAFAKVIQSFSRVRDLGLDKANSLKEFLFEDDDKEYLEEYLKHKQQLDKLLTDFKDLNSHIDDIEHKQKVLKQLNGFEKQMNESKFNFDLKEIVELDKQYSESQNQEQELSKNLSCKVDRRKYLEDREKKFKRLTPAVESYYEEIESNYTFLLQYESKYNSWKRFDSEITQLRGIHYSNFSEETVNNSSPIDFKLKTTKEIIEKVNAAIPLFVQYGQLSDIIRKHHEQEEKLSSLALETENKLKQLDRIINLLVDRGTNSLFGQVIREKKILSLHQESVLLSLIDISLEKPEKAIKGLRYALSTNILNENNFEFDKQNKGIWLKLGELREFIELSKDERIFESGSDFENILSNKIDKLNIQVTKLKQEKEELNKIKKLQPYDKRIIKDYDFDIRLIEYSGIENLKQIVWMICNKEVKISHLLSESAQLKSDIDTILSQITIPVNTQNLFGLVKQYEAKKKLVSIRKNRLQDKKNKESNELSHLNGELPHLQKELKEKQEEIAKLLNSYNFKKGQFVQQHPDEDFSASNDIIETKSLDELETEFNIAQENYITEYKSIVGLFRETREGKNPQINIQVNNTLYQFRILEEVLLGGKIRYLDNVSDYLREANEQRLSIVENIRENMIKVFSKTLRRYQDYDTIVKNLNTFFIGKKISDTYYLNLNFKEYDDINIGWIDELQKSARWVNKPGELEFGHSVQEFIEELFKKITGIRKAIEFKDLLNPKTYFDLTVKLTDEEKNEIPGSTGETYSAIVLLGIARLSKVQEKRRNGLRFIILEELANLDDTNFNVFPKIAREFDYQILTMTPKPYNSDSEDGWYLHHLIKGNKDNNINYPVPASYYKTRENRIDLENYLKALER